MIVMFKFRIEQNRMEYVEWKFEIEWNGMEYFEQNTDCTNLNKIEKIVIKQIEQKSN